MFTGPALFDHLVGYARTHTSAHIKLIPSSYLNVEMTKDQHILLHPTVEDLTRGRIMQDAHGEGTLRFLELWCEKTLSEIFFTGAQKYLAKRKLDSAGFIKAHSGIANRPERVKRMKSELQLADSLALRFPVQKKLSMLSKKPLLLRSLRSGCRKASKAAHGCFEAHDAGDPRTFSTLL
jgi:hypothetical protein